MSQKQTLLFKPVRYNLRACAKCAMWQLSDQDIHNFSFKHQQLNCQYLSHLSIAHLRSSVSLIIKGFDKSNKKLGPQSSISNPVNLTDLVAIPGQGSI